MSNKGCGTHGWLTDACDYDECFSLFNQSVTSGTNCIITHCSRTFNPLSLFASKGNMDERLNYERNVT